MSRNVVAHGNPDRSFAGLMDHLTGFDREGASHSDPGPDFGATFRRSPRPDSAPTDESLTNPRSGPRTLLPVTERRPAPVESRDASALSYEKALSLHARRRLPATSSGGSKPAPQPRAAFRARESPAPGASKTSAASQSATGQTQGRVEPTPEFRAEVARPESVLPSKGGKPPGKEAGAANAFNVARTKEKALPRAASSPAAVLDAAPSRKHLGVPPQGAPKTSVRLSKGTSPARAASPAERSTQAGAAAVSSALPGSVRNAARSRPTPGVAPAAIALKQSKTNSRKKSALANGSSKAARSPSTANPARRSGAGETSREDIALLEPGTDDVDTPLPAGQLELLHPFGELDQRRTIVSVRLTEGEFACLRDRAEESGISVSAYMRSCVVDADQLRAQVKRALQEMRSLSGPDGTGQMAALTTPGRSNDGPRPSGSQGWFKLVLRPLAILFGPLFPTRHSP